MQEEKKFSVLTPEQASAVKSFISGGVGGMCLVLVGQPFDLVKVRLQATNMYTSAGQAFRSIVRTEGGGCSDQGLKGLYRGMSTPLIGVTPIFAVCFWGYDLGQRLMRTAREYNPYATKNSEKLTTTELVLAGGFSAIPATLLMAPSERIKVLLQVQDAKNRQFSGPISVIRHLWKEGGISSVYRGTGATLLRDIPGSMAYFGAYEIVKSALSSKENDGQLNPLAVLTAGGMAGVANWLVAIPADVVKSRLQTAPTGTYRGTMDCLVRLVKTDGPGALFKGLGPAIVRAFPANAACFFGVEVATRVLNGLF